MLRLRARIGIKFAIPGPVRHYLVNLQGWNTEKDGKLSIQGYQWVQDILPAFGFIDRQQQILTFAGECLESGLHQGQNKNIVQEM